MSKGYERRGKGCVWRFLYRAQEQATDLAAMLDRPWYKARYTYRVYCNRNHITVSIKRKAKQ